MTNSSAVPTSGTLYILCLQRSDKEQCSHLRKGCLSTSITIRNMVKQRYTPTILMITKTSNLGPFRNIGRINLSLTPPTILGILVSHAHRSRHMCYGNDLFSNIILTILHRWHIPYSYQNIIYITAHHIFPLQKCIPYVLYHLIVIEKTSVY